MLEMVQNGASRCGTNLAKAVFNCRQVHQEWQAWLANAFQASQIHNSLLYLLINGIKDRRFVEESIVYGKDLINHAVAQPEVIESSLEMTKEVLIKEPRVVNASLELCKWFVKEPVVYDLTKDFMQGVVLRHDLYDIMIWQLACAGFDALQGLSPDDTPVRNSMQQHGFDLLANPAIQSLATHNYLLLPLLNTFTLGIYGLVAPADQDTVDAEAAAAKADSKEKID